MRKTKRRRTRKEHRYRAWRHLTRDQQEVARRLTVGRIDLVTISGWGIVSSFLAFLDELSFSALLDREGKGVKPVLIPIARLILTYQLKIFLGIGSINRKGTANLFVHFQPQGGWRHVAVTDRRTQVDFAHQMWALVEMHLPEAEVIRVVIDNLNTHKPAALYDAFPPAEAGRVLQKLEFPYTPKHVSWLKMVEIELSVLAAECLDRRIADKATLTREVAAWEATRNQAKATVNWRCTVNDARTKLRRLYPS